MFSKIACFLTFLAMANAFPQKVWPAGVSPAACPNYPDCDNSIDPTLGVARNAPTPNVPSLQFPAGVSAAACPDFPFCTQRSAVPSDIPILLDFPLVSLLPLAQ